MVGLTSLVGALTARRAGNVLLGRGVAFGAVAIAGASAGARLSGLVPEAVLLAAFAVLLVVVASVMAVRLRPRPHRRPGHAGPGVRSTTRSSASARRSPASARAR